MIEDVEHFVGSFSAFHQAMPDENQHILRQVINQVSEAGRLRTGFLRGGAGLEPIWTFEKNGVEVSKRVFHPGKGEHAIGADFMISKKVTPGLTGITLVQVKRNRGNQYYEFRQRDLDQFHWFSRWWGSAYYMMVDETIVPPADCFLTVWEIENLLGNPPRPSQVSNVDVRRSCRGPNVFYGAFYSCWRGSRLGERLVINRALSYTSETKRILLELFATRGKKRTTSKA